jgi:hypothetical protein
MDYFVVYWVTEVIDSVLMFLVVYEIYFKAFESYAGLQRLGTLLFHCAAGIVVLLAVVSIGVSFAHQTDTLIAGVMAIQQGAAIVNGGLLLFLLAICGAFRLSWRVYTLGIALGLSLYLTLNLVGVTVREVLGPGLARWYSLWNNAAYDCGVLTWLAYVAQHDRTISFTRSRGRELLDKWNRALLTAGRY